MCDNPTTFIIVHVDLVQHFIVDTVLQLRTHYQISQDNHVDIEEIHRPFSVDEKTEGSEPNGSKHYQFKQMYRRKFFLLLQG
jgi:hypothetical protein